MVGIGSNNNSMAFEFNDLTLPPQVVEDEPLTLRLFRGPSLPLEVISGNWTTVNDGTDKFVLSQTTTGNSYSFAKYTGGKIDSGTLSTQLNYQQRRGLPYLVYFGLDSNNNGLRPGLLITLAVS
jgi:hypothetical protein